MSQSTSILLDLTGKTADELLELKSQLEIDINSIRTQIARARIDARETGTYAESDWWQKAHTALRIKGRHCQQVQNALRTARRSRAKAVEQEFLRIARETLSPEEFRSWLERAYSRLGVKRPCTPLGKNA